MKTCPKCYATHQDTVLTCDCGQDLGAIDANTEAGGAHTHAALFAGKEDYDLYRRIGSLLSILAWLALALSVGWAILCLATQQLLSALGMVFYGLVSFCCLYAMSRTITILLEIRQMLLAQQEDAGH